MGLFISLDLYPRLFDGTQLRVEICQFKPIRARASNRLISIVLKIEAESKKRASIGVSRYSPALDAVNLAND